MSRIHEALKKAEEERATVEAAGAVASPLDQTITPPVRGGATRTAPAPQGPQTVVPAAAGAYLRFDDLRARCAHPNWNMDPNLNVFLASNRNSLGAEQFRTLRSRLYQLRNSQPLGTLLITSSVSGEGKTFVTHNLAQVIVRQPDRRVLIIDADLRCSRLHMLLGAPPAPGLTDYLRGEADEIAVIQHGQDGNLCFIPGGNEVTSPSELLSNGRLKALLDRVKPVFDWVILDSPPCLLVSDASVMADLCAGVLMVVRAGVTPSETAQRACQEFRERNLIGAVLNGADPSRGYGYYASHYEYGYSRSKA